VAELDPIARIRSDRAEARKLDDPNADTCFLALADKEGNASIRTLVLRDIADNHFLLFVNQSSPKWRIIQAGGTYELLIWYPSMQRQYRIGGGVKILDDEFVKRNWLRRPRGSKYLDLLYEHTTDQSSFIESRQHLVDHISRIRAEYNVDEIEAPNKVAGLELIAERVEMLDLNREDRIHDRQLFILTGGGWSAKVMIP